jgi:hypothetical protein
MIRSLLGWLVSIAKRLVDDTIPEEDLHTYLRRGLAEFRQAIETGDIAADHQLIPLISQAAERLQKQGIPEIPTFNKTPMNNSDEGERADIGSAASVVQKGIIKERIVNDISLAVDLNRPLSEQQLTQMEVLIRHIEVRRKAALRFEGPRSDEERWSSAARISSLFSRYAKRETDYRFLNTALKLNDWAYRFYRSRLDQPRNSPFLLAVLEAEATLLEMAS